MWQLQQQHDGLPLPPELWDKTPASNPAPSNSVACSIGLARPKEQATIVAVKVGSGFGIAGQEHPPPADAMHITVI